MLAALAQYGLNLENQQKNQQIDGILKDKTFLFTGALQQLKRNDAEALVEAKGGKILGSVSAKLNYLVVGEDAGSKLEKAKKLSTVHILTEQEFVQMVKDTE
jgi:DNA ligase (NAD+)